MERGLRGITAVMGTPDLTGQHQQEKFRVGYGARDYKARAPL
jgi:hypothetical protein